MDKDPEAHIRTLEFDPLLTTKYTKENHVGQRARPFD